MVKDKIGRFLSDLAQWVASQADIQALALVGSQARNAAAETSDVDLILIATAPNRYLDDTNWAQQFGAIKRQQVEDYGRVTSIRAWYADGREVEYGITDERWAATPLDEGTRKVMEDGMRILFERGTLLSHHLVEE